MARRGLSGQYGSMPIEEYLKKLERTPVYEEPNQLYEYNRNLLRDTSTDKPWFESDFKRDNSAYSREFINLRTNGQRADDDTVPDLPDGTFLDWEWLNKDMRLSGGDPDWQEYRKEIAARARDTRFYSDADNSVPESGIPPAKMVELMRQSQFMLKGKLLFRESEDHLKRLSKDPSPPEAAVHLAENSARTSGSHVHSNFKAAPNYNVTECGWRSENDMDFKAAKLGLAPSAIGGHYMNANTHINRRSTLDSRAQTPVLTASTQQALVLLMSNLTSLKANSYSSNDVIFGSSNKSTNLKSAKPSIITQNAIETRSYEIVRMLGEVARHRKIYAGNASKLGLSAINPIIVEHMPLANKKLGTQTITIVNNTVGQIAIDSLRTQSNSKFRTPTDTRRILNESLDFSYKEDSKTAINYGGLKPSNNTPQYLAGEDYGDESTMRTNAKMGIVTNHYSQDLTEEEIEFGEGTNARSGTTRLGNKYSRRSTLQEELEDNDIWEQTRSIGKAGKNRKKILRAGV